MNISKTYSTDLSPHPYEKLILEYVEGTIRIKKTDMFGTDMVFFHEERLSDIVDFVYKCQNDSKD